MAEAFGGAIEDVRTLIIGAGMGGIGVALELTRRGEDDFIVIDRGPKAGGVWRDNQYPTAATDTPIELYAFAESLGSKWSTNYAPWNEILEYLDGLIDDSGLESHIQFETVVDALVWDPEAGHWHVSATNGQRWRARFVVWAGGLLSRPSIPKLPGLDQFEGEVLHTARWRDDVDLAGKKVLVVGGGATSIQVVPLAAESAAEVYALVRTPSYVLPKPEVFFTDEDRATFAVDHSRQTAERSRLLAGFEELSATRFPMDGERIKKQERAWEQYIDSVITDPRLRDVLTPKYRYGCRRPLVSNTYYQAFEQPNVTGFGGSISEVRPTSVVTTDHGEIDVDTIIFATGFEAQDMMGDLHVDNGHGVTMKETWKERPRAYVGTLVAGFPNLFIINGPNTGGPVVTDVISSQSRFLANCMEWAGPDGTVEVDPDVFEEFNRDVDARAETSVLVQGGCTSWYRAGGDGGVFSHWPGSLSSLISTIDGAPREHLIITSQATYSDASLV